MSRSEESVLLRCASNMAGRASKLDRGRAQQAMMWLAQMFVMVDRDADLNHLLRCSDASRKKPTIYPMKPPRLASSYREYRHGPSV